MSTIGMSIKIAAAAFGVGAVVGLANAAKAETVGGAADGCTAEAWAAFAAAVEGNDMAALQRLMGTPAQCAVLATTARVLVCEADPLLCVEPAARPVLAPESYGYSTAIDCPVWRRNCTDPLPPPGSHIGVENDYRDHPTTGGETPPPPPPPPPSTVGRAPLS